MKKLVLATTALIIVSGPAIAIDCTHPPYGSTMERYENFIQANKETGLLDDPERTIRKICNAKDIPGKPRQALFAVGFTFQEISETDTLDLLIKYLKRAREVLHGEE
jgi:hypothetical protein